MLAGLRDRGHHVVIGNDLSELTMLLDVNRPTSVVYALGSYDDIAVSSFKRFLHSASKLSIPVIMIDFDDPRVELTLHHPLAGDYVVHKLAGSALTNVVEALLQNSQLEQSENKDAGFEPLADVLKSHMLESDDYVRRFLEIGMKDTIGEGRSAVEIETKIEGSGEVRLVTLVRRNGAVLVREEQLAEETDPTLVTKMELQHLEAVKTYAPVQAARFKRIEKNPKTEVSGPLDTPMTPSGAILVISDGWYGRIPLILALLSAGLLIAVAAAVFLALNTDIGQLPNPIERPEIPKTAHVDQARSQRQPLNK